MKKYAFLTYHKDYMSFLKGLQDAGVVHIVEKKEEISEELRQSFQTIHRIKETIKFLKKRDVEFNPVASDKADGLKILDEVTEKRNEIEGLQQQLGNVKKQILLAEAWGEFSNETIEKLEKQGVKIRFFICSEKNFDPAWKEKHYIEEVNKIGESIYFVAFQKGEDGFELENADEVKKPEKPVSEYQLEKTSIENHKEELEKELDEYASKYLDVLQHTINEIESKTDFQLAVENTEKKADDKVMLLEGWIPESKESSLSSYLEETNALAVKGEPEKGDKPPVLLKNNKFARLFEPVGELYSLPKYGEIDLTPFFAPFFMLFFGFCLGDAGYGLLMIVAALYFASRIKDLKSKRIAYLISFLGLATVLFGAITGTFFGINLIDTGYTVTNQTMEYVQQENVPEHVLSKIESIKGTHFETKSNFEGKLEDVLSEENFEKYSESIVKFTEADYQWINKFRHMLLDPTEMFNLSLVFGVIQILLGWFIKAANQIKQEGFYAAVSTIGWILLAIGGGLLYLLRQNAAIDQQSFQSLLYVILGISGVAIFVLNDIRKNPLINIGTGIWDTYNMVTGVLGDILSYIRLFALGISSAILGFVFNDLAINMSGNIPVVSHLIFIVILLFGHSINIFMSGLGAFVHPLRLTFVEFYSNNAGFTGGGKKYKPLMNKNNF